MIGYPESVMSIAEEAVDAMAVAGMNVTVAVVAMPFAWEPRVTAGDPAIKFNMAGIVPVVEASSNTWPSLVVAAWTAVMAACAADGLLNCAKFKATGAFAAKLPPAVRAIKIFKVLPVIEGLHVAPEAGAVT